MIYSYFLIRNRYLSEYDFICILGNLEEKKAELKEHTCILLLTDLDAISLHRRVHRTVIQLDNAIQISEDKLPQSNFSSKLVLTLFQCNSFVSV